MTKHSGLSHLADVSRSLLPHEPDYYPIRKRGEKRRLAPNWPAIEWLEKETLHRTEITYTARSDGADDGIKVLYTRGRRTHDRPMFQIIPENGFSGGWTGTRGQRWCCSRFDVSWNCEQHHEIPWDTERRRWERPCTGDLARCQCWDCVDWRIAQATVRREDVHTVEPEARYPSIDTEGLRMPQELLGRLEGVSMTLDMNVDPPIIPEALLAALTGGLNDVNPFFTAQWEPDDDPSTSPSASEVEPDPRDHS